MQPTYIPWLGYFDMIDFVFKKDGAHISFNETPLGHILINNNIDEKKLMKLKDYPIVYINKNGNKALVNLIDEANDKNLNQCVDLIKSIIW